MVTLQRVITFQETDQVSAFRENTALLKAFVRSLKITGDQMKPGPELEENHDIPRKRTVSQCIPNGALSTLIWLSCLRQASQHFTPWCVVSAETVHQQANSPWCLSTANVKQEKNYPPWVRNTLPSHLYPTVFLMAKPWMWSKICLHHLLFSFRIEDVTLPGQNIFSQYYVILRFSWVTMKDKLGDCVLNIL